MYVCLCAGITDSQIRQAVIQGCRSLWDLSQELGVASGCGKCACMAQAILQQTLTEMPAINDPKAA